MRETPPAGRTALDRRRFIGAAAASVAGAASAVAIGATPAAASPGRHTFSTLPAPKPIAFSTPPDPTVPVPFDSINWALPGPVGASTQFIGIPSFGPDADPNTIGDFEGFTAYAVVAGTATGSDGEPFDCEFDVRVMQGRYVAEDGSQHSGTFAFL